MSCHGVTGPSRFGLTLAVMLALAASLCYHENLLQRWDLLFYDLAIKTFYRVPDDRILIVGIDEKSLAELGAWPWSRRLHAALIDKLSDAGARVVGMDVLFAEPDSVDAGADAALRGALSRSGKVVLPVCPEVPGSGSRLSLTLPTPELADAAGRLGHVDVELGEDGVARQVSLAAGMGSHYWQALPQAMLSLADVKFRQPDGGIPHGPISGTHPETWVRDLPVFIPFAGPPGTFPHVSYADLLMQEEIGSALRQKYVLVGMTAAGLGSRFSTPASTRSEPMSGVEFNANVLDVLLNDLVVFPVPMHWGIILTALLILPPYLTYGETRERWALPATGLACVLSIGLSLLLLRVWHFWYAPTAPLAALVLGYPLWSWRRLEETAHRLSEEKQRATATLNAVGDAVVALNEGGAVVYMNPVAEQLTGFSSSESLGQPLEAIFVPAIDEEQVEEDYVSAIRRCLREGRPFNDSKPFFLVNRAGVVLAVRVSANPTLDPAGRFSGMVVALSEITETLQISRQLTFLATHDQLTELPNRSLLYDRLQQAIFKVSRSGARCGILFVDLDGFKKVNDGLGHAVGDRVIMETARRLVASVRRVDTTARWGGDEFVILIEQIEHERNAASIAQKILTSLGRPYRIGDHEIFVTPSIGISIFPRDGEEAELLVARADAAMYRAKESGGNRMVFFSESVNVLARERLKMETELHHALENREFEIHYQPQIEPRSGRIFAVEALLRWRHPEKGVIWPSHFIPVAEDSGLINPIGEWVIRDVCRQLRAWKEENANDLVAAVNLSPRQFLVDGLSEIIVDSLAESCVDPSRLKVEITESQALKNIDFIAKTLEDLHSEGVSVSLDDFGTGYSSLSVLKRLPIDQLKIDKSFVMNVANDAHDAGIAQAVIALAHGLDMSVIAEGVETQAQLDFFTERRCDGIQGYYFSRPLAVQDFTKLLRRTAIV